MSQLQENTYFAGRYKLVKKLGSGGFSVVWLAEDTMAGNTKIALKIYAPDKGLDKDGIDNFRKEYAITLNLNHSSLLSAKHFDVSDGSPYLIMQFMSEGSALKLIEKIDEKRLAKFIYQVSSGLEYLHSHEPPIVHQDIKPDNVLISSKGDFLLTDFGISTRVRRTLTKSAANVGYSGTIAYVPPERYMRNPKPQPEGDIFAFGIMLFEMMTGYLPWNEQGGLGFIGSQVIPPLDVDGFSDALKSLCISCISFKPEDRPTAMEVRIYAQQYVQNGFWDDKYKPSAVKGAEEITAAESKRLAEEKLKQQEIETERLKAKEAADKEKKKLAEQKAAEEERNKQIAEANKIKEQEEKRRKEEIDKKFGDLVNKADREFSSANFQQALNLFNEALKLRNTDAYVNSKISDCKNNLDKERNERRKQDEQKYIQNVTREAGDAFNAGKLKDARKKYTTLLSKDANNTEASNRLKEIEAIAKQNSIESRRKLVKILIPLIIVIAIGGGAAWFFMQPKPPVAGFSADKLTITEGESVTFISNSESAKSLNWSFDGGEPASSTSQKETVKFVKPGKYSVKLLAKNDDGENSTFQKNYITVLKKVEEKKIELPEVDFFANKTSIVTGNTVSFTSGAKNAERLSWSFENGDPASSSDNKPNVKYTKPGKYKVSLTAYNEAGEKTKTKKSYITVARDIKKPTADFVADVSTIYVGDTVRFYDQSSFAYSRKWIFNGGEPFESADESPIVVYNNVGSYPVELEVKNPKGSNQITKELFIEVLQDPEIVKQNAFNDIVAEADNLFSKQLLSKSLSKYNEANDLIADNAHVVSRIKEINTMLDSNSAYETTIASADKYFKDDSFENARKKYNEALSIKPGESYPKSMLSKISKILSVDNIAFKIPDISKSNSRQILVSVTGNTAVVRVEVGDVYKDNKVKLIISAEWKDKKARPMSVSDEEIAIRKRDVKLSSSNLHFENFDYADYLAFSNGATLKLVADKGFEGGKVKVSINLMMMLGMLNSSTPQVVSYSNKNPSGNLEIEFEMQKYYKSK